ncbi:low molecular weight phosphotyrosine protein phosphatase [Lucifera butyrica]|uniref:Low molecular weight phosphotyrosine protein phosphatase n=1 Tax=Lucifera butyrica TaxID=1351585 RepID=A0A498R6E5_9FIRM|nr:arsenate reductase ArsC [Lucifera butyrica]VBB06437.1 low molecular weight phosphotyrosine protein phosphatase [Lucifera butyrica]
MRKDKLLILCTQNSARSQMAEAFFEKYGGDILEAYSAGLEPTAVNPYAVRVMQEVGINLSGKRSKSFREFLGRMQFGYVIGVCKKVEKQCPSIFPGGRNCLSWPFEDPAAYEGTDEEKLAKFREVRDQIDEKVRMWVDDFRHGRVDCQLCRERKE